MLRMGRSPKVESNEPQQPAQPSPQPQPAQSYAQPTPQTYETPARAASATPATPAAAATPSTPRAVTESEALARDLREGVVSGFVGSGTVVSGDAEFKGMLRIDGRFTGRVRSEKGSLIVSAGGVVEADVAVASAKINGTVNGDIVATEKLELGRSARVTGNIQTPALVIDDGAVFEGSCRMRPAAKPEPAKSPKAETAATQPRQPAAVPAPATPAPTTPAPAARAAAAINSNSPEPSA